jgi:hypothetical protein
VGGITHQKEYSQQRPSATGAFAFIKERLSLQEKSGLKLRT